MKKMNNLRTGLYEHYKGKHYEVIGIAHHSETCEELVVYTALYETDYGNDSLWVRPFSMFTEIITVNGKEIPRFRYIDKEESNV